MAKIEERIFDFIPELIDKMKSDSLDREEFLSWVAMRVMKEFECVDSAIYIVDKDGKNGYTLVNGRDPKQRNIPFTVKAKAEIASYLEPGSKSVLTRMDNFPGGVFKFEEFVKILWPVGQNGSSYLFVEMDKPGPQELKSVLRGLKIMGPLIRSEIEATEIYKLLYGSGEAGRRSDDGKRDKTLSELAGSVAHLLNQPLTSLMGYVELLIKKGDSQKQDITYLNKIYNEAERLADVIRKIEAVNSYATEDYIGSTKILKLDEAESREVIAKGGKGEVREKRVSKKLEVFLEFYKAVSKAKNRGESVHHYAFSINRMFPNLRMVLLAYREDTDKFFLEYKEKGGYGRDFELSEDKVSFYKKILDELTLKIYRFDDGQPHIITIPLVIDEHRLGIAEFDFEKEEISIFDIILIESMTEELVLSLSRLKLSEKNRYLKDYISNLIENTQALIFTISEDHAIKTCNPAFEESVGYAKAEMENRKMADMVEGEKAGEVLRKVIEEALSGKVVRKIDLALKTRAKGKIDVSFSLIPLPKVKNLRPEVLAIGQNITDVKQLEKQVMQAEKLAYLGQMAACVAHELNNPLTSITVFTEYLLKRVEGDLPGKGEAYREKLSRIYESANRIHSFTRNLTSFAQPSETQFPERVSVNNIIRESVLFSEYEIDREKVELECLLDEELPNVDGYKSQLHQVFINLIANASHAMGENSGKITIITDDYDTDFIRIEIRDTGEGIEPKVLEKVFEPFNTTRKGAGGTGLGLTIVKRIIDNHKGIIEVKSELGKGTSFTIFLPKQF